MKRIFTMLLSVAMMAFIASAVEPISKQGILSGISPTAVGTVKSDCSIPMVSASCNNVARESTYTLEDFAGQYKWTTVSVFSDEMGRPVGTAYHNVSFVIVDGVLRFDPFGDGVGVPVETDLKNGTVTFKPALVSTINGYDTNLVGGPMVLGEDGIYRFDASKLGEGVTAKFNNGALEFDPNYMLGIGNVDLGVYHELGNHNRMMKIIEPSCRFGIRSARVS